MSIVHVGLSWTTIDQAFGTPCAVCNASIMYLKDHACFFLRCDATDLLSLKFKRFRSISAPIAELDFGILIMFCYFIYNV